jgi:hypothetical protein
MLNLGSATVDITPDRPAMVQGQMHVRIATKARDPLTVTALAITGQRADGSPQHAVLVSADICIIPRTLQEQLRQRVANAIPELDPMSVVIFATHTHDSMVLVNGAYPPQSPEVMTPDECLALVVERMGEAVIAAWQDRKPCKIARGFGHAVVAHNRRPVFADGSALMYGDPTRADFRAIEGPEDHTVDFLFVWDESDELQGVLIDLPCPSQVDERLSEWSADFWHETRLEIAERVGNGVWTFPICGIGGDVSPHPIFNKKQQQQWRELRGLDERQEIADRIVSALLLALQYAEPIEGPIVFAHEFKAVSFPHRVISQKERDWHEKTYNDAITQMDPRLWWPKRLQEVVDIFDGKKTGPAFPGELHAFRIADAVLATNPFELYADYGLQIKARSPAGQTFLSQLTTPTGMYLPTQRGVDNGGYGSIPAVSFVGPDGGQMLVETTLELINKLFPAAKK